MAATAWGSFFTVDEASAAILQSLHSAQSSESPAQRARKESDSASSVSEPYRYESTTHLSREHLSIFGRHPASAVSHLSLALCAVCQTPVRPEFMLRHYEFHHCPESAAAVAALAEIAAARAAKAAPTSRQNSSARRSQNNTPKPITSKKSNSSFKKKVSSRSSAPPPRPGPLVVVPRPPSAPPPTIASIPEETLPPPTPPSPLSFYEGPISTRIPNIIIKPLPPRPVETPPTPPHTPAVRKPPTPPVQHIVRKVPSPNLHSVSSPGHPLATPVPRNTLITSKPPAHRLTPSAALQHRIITVTSAPSPHRITTVPSPQRITAVPSPQRITSAPSPQRITAVPSPQRIASAPSPQLASPQLIPSSPLPSTSSPLPPPSYLQSKFIDLPSSSRTSLFNPSSSSQQSSDSPPPLTPAASSDTPLASVRVVGMAPSNEPPPPMTRFVLTPGDQKKKKFLPLSERTFDPDSHCGVVDTTYNLDGTPNLLTPGPCLRSLTCKIHSVTARRAVAGRNRKFDELLLEKKQAKPLQVYSIITSEVGDANANTIIRSPPEKRARLTLTQQKTLSPATVVDVRANSDLYATSVPTTSTATIIPVTSSQLASLVSSSFAAPSPTRAVTGQTVDEVVPAPISLQYTTTHPRPVAHNTSIIRRIGHGIVTASPYPSAFVYYKLKSLLCNGATTHSQGSAIPARAFSVAPLSTVSPVLNVISGQPSLIFCPPEE